MTEIAPRSAAAFPLARGDILKVIDPEGGQVSDMLACVAGEPGEMISNGRTFDYEETVRLTTGNRLWSNRSRPLLEIVEDRYNAGSLIITSQVPIDHWYEIVGDPTLADAILDRVVHNAHRIELKGESLRKPSAG